MLDKLVDLLVECAALFKFWIVLQPFEAGFITRLGKNPREIGPGLHWLIPFGVDHTGSEYVVPRTASLGEQSATTKDGMSIAFHAIVTYKVQNVLKAMLEVHDLSDAITDSCTGIIGQTLSTLTWKEIHETDVTPILLASCRDRATKWGVRVIAVQLAGVSIARNIRLMNSGAVTRHDA